MNKQNEKKQYSFLAKFWHWGFVLLFIYGVAKQVDEIEQLEDNFFFQFEIVFALIFLFLLINCCDLETIKKRIKVISITHSKEIVLIN